MDHPDSGTRPAGATRETEDAARPKAASDAGGSIAATSPGAGAQSKSGRRRRKRRRGRKVFAPAVSAAQPVGGAAAVATPAIVAPVPVAVVGDVTALAASPLLAVRNEVFPVSPPTERPAVAAPAGSGAYAALDLGTNNCRLLVAVPGRPGQFRVIDAFSRIVRLGEGLSASGRLADAAMDRAVQALAVCADKLASRPGARRRLVATEACRAAANGAEFLSRVERETGLQLEIIERQTEARLAVSGCGSLVERGTDAVVLFDIGGGSSEIALVDVSRRRSPHLADHIAAWTSLPVGVVSLAERFGGREVTRETFAAMVEEVRGMIDAFAGRQALGRLASGQRFHLLGTSGTVTTLAGVHLGLARYDRRQVDGLWMSSPQVDAMIERLLGWDFAARVANPCIGADRADLVLAGCAILEAIRMTWPAERLRVADRGLREGILTELMAGDGVWSRGAPNPGQRR